MSLTPRRSDCFSEDFDLQYRWYLREAGEAVAERYFAAVLTTVLKLVQNPGLGRARRFRHEALWGLCSFRVMRPFQRHLIFYRVTETEMFAERLMHGARDLPRRLREAPGAE